MTLEWQFIAGFRERLEMLDNRERSYCSNNLRPEPGARIYSVRGSGRAARVEKR